PLTRSLVIFRANPPVHAPTAVAGAALAEQVFKSRPEVGREWADYKFHKMGSVPHMRICGTDPIGLGHCFGNTNSKPYWGARAIIFCFSLYGISASGGSVIEGAGTLQALKNPSPPAGASCTRMRTCSESIVNEWGMSRGANTTVPGVALSVRSPMEKV